MAVPKITALEIPCVGYGTGTKWYKYGNDEIDQTLVSMLKEALAAGFTHIDSAECYNTDLEVAAALEGVPRESYFLTDKYYCGDSTTKKKSKWATPYERAKAALKLYGVPYIDLYLLHSPFITPEVNDGLTIKEAWKSMEKAKAEGLVKHIGVSNFAVEHLKELLEGAQFKPEANQIEYNVFLQNQTDGIVDFCKANGIVIEAYSPLAPLNKPIKESKIADELIAYLDELAKKYSRTSSQILLKWVEQMGIIPITTTGKPSRMAEILDTFESSFKLEDSEVDKIKKIGDAFGNRRLYWTLDFPPAIRNETSA